MVPRRAALSGPLLVAVLVTAAGCGGGEVAGGGGGGTPVGTSSAAPATTAEAPTPGAGEPPGADGGGPDGSTDGDGNPDAAPFPADTEPDTARPSPGALVGVTDIRIGRHDGFDRVVLEVDGQGAPGWDVRYVDRALSQGSGADVAVEGDAVLQVTLTGTGYPADTGVEEYPGPDRLAAGATEVVTEVFFDSTFEGQTVTFVGTTARAPFRVYALQDPARVVLEVADPR